MKFLDAEAQCESDGAYLALPRSDDENDFIAGLIPNEHIWIGLNDIAEEGKFVTSDGLDLSYTKWDINSNQPNNYNGSEDGVHIIGKGMSWLTKGFWNDGSINAMKKFVCLYSIHEN